MSKSKLFISDDAPELLKTVISVSQKMVDNLEQYKTKSNAGTLTLSDLGELSRRNALLAEELPAVEDLTEDQKSQVHSMEELQARADEITAEEQKRLKEKGPVVDFSSLEKMKEMALTMSPVGIGTMILTAAKKQREDEVGIEETETAEEAIELPGMKAKKEFERDLIKENLDLIHDYLFRAKKTLFDVQENWKEVEPFEKQLHRCAKAFGGYKQSGIELLKGILTGEEKDEDLADKIPEAAFILAAIATEDGRELESLIELWETDETLAPFIIQALKYTSNPILSRWLQNTLTKRSPTVQAGFIEVLEFHRLVANEKWDQMFASGDLKVTEKLYRACLNSGVRVTRDVRARLLEDPKAEHYEDALFSALLSGDDKALITTRKRLFNAPEKVVKLPLYFACACGETDLLLIKRCIPEKKSETGVVSALGILGLPQGVPDLINLFASTITSKEDWDRERHIVNSLELIAGADLPLIFPEINEGPEGKEYEVTVEIDWKNQWLSWWIENRGRFETGVRYRRGKRFTLESCIDEMAYPSGCYWSRQSAYHELQIRSGRHNAPFFADWEVNHQLESIELWRHWWQEYQHQLPQSQWLFNGQVI